ncbi:ABC-F family ATP-binding cassette domain-containing protein [Ethanoligenens harbinense]|uniref:ABC transporter related protein n=1 Tax=Ethanoligenens harbinense (strain DSM 18485 / JCM 12961 / CGMCC 1.5033 / YUAN-3) TaxID=663278 RepID=E6U7N6_ETHHY|nr:ATP-binding cassette domain-containing protein [Ethanoligenens harbinense]ADU28159.1 ABC transporter related protein [Ethanoligenens harbinense YUAN-3]AVQ97162.1 ABC transporter ATP-binding protein [Ethanoligenens harbinense YUAN-3]AYF39825.1 ABC transporter ATP-binding protein [Ethanoligenens harbinense]AYF42657.1 ABC transporter ATP-binding protein [Ethanoligenens harbinense]QCN93406.1 ATP-binding cassette domain-containing protein [Ethanoligenens harbinense]
MITVSNVSLSFQDKKLFDNVNLKFTPGNCYGVIGANGAGKTSFIKILSGELVPTGGEVIVTPGERLAVLKQDHFQFDQFTVLQTVILGHKRLYDIMQEKDALYAKPDFSEEDGEKAAALESEFAELDGWNAESDAERLLTGLGVDVSLHGKQMQELDGNDKVKVLLAQALFGNPHILLLDEPTNHLDIAAITWLESFLLDYPNTVIVISHDRHFLNQVCTHMVDIDFGKMNLVVGNYDFWYESSQLAQRLLAEQNRKKEEKIKELQTFIERFSSNASKAKQATSRKKLLEKITLDDIRPSSRRYPYVGFTPNREAGKDILSVEGICKTVDGVPLLKDVTFTVNKGDKIVFSSHNELARTLLFQILMGEIEPDSGSFKWGVTTSQSYLPRDVNAYFEDPELTIIDWLRQFSEDKHESYIRGFLGKMLFSGDDALKKAQVLSGGEKMRCMFSKLMLSGANVLLLDDPTNHLDLESITAVNNGLKAFPGTMLFTSHDLEFIETIANRVIELTPAGIYDKQTSFADFLENEDAQQRIAALYADA